MFAVVEGRLAGLVSVADPVKQTTPEALKALHAEGLRIVIVTGDNERTARAAAGRLGSDEIRADVLPEAKARTVKELQAAGARVARDGDGLHEGRATDTAD